MGVCGVCGLCCVRPWGGRVGWVMCVRVGGVCVCVCVCGMWGWVVSVGWVICGDVGLVEGATASLMAGVTRVDNWTRHTRS